MSDSERNNTPLTPTLSPLRGARGTDASAPQDPLSHPAGAGEGGVRVVDRPRHPEKMHRPDSPVLRKPDWIRVKAPVSREYQETRALMRRLKLNTVCEE